MGCLDRGGSAGLVSSCSCICSLHADFVFEVTYGVGDMMSFVYFILCTCVGETKVVSQRVWGRWTKLFSLPQRNNVVSRWRLKRRKEFKGRGKCLFGGRRDCRERYRRNMIILKDRLSETDPCILLLVIILPILTFATPKLLVR